MTLNDDQELDSVLPGYHVDLTITINEAINATSVHIDVVNNYHVWKLDDEGKLDLVPVQTGIQMGEQLEIISGLSIGNVVTNEPISPSYKGMPFITPIKFSDVAWLDIGKYRDKLLYMMAGIVTR